jgi:phospholipase C
VIKFVEQNWQTGEIGDSSFDHRAGSLDGLFNFRVANDKQVLLNQDGSIASVRPLR